MVRTLLLFVKSWDEIHVSWKAITSKMVLPECYLFKGASTWFVYLEKFNLSFQVRCLWSLCQSSPSLIIFVLFFFYLYCISSSLLSWQTIIFVKLVSIQTNVIFYMAKITLKFCNWSSFFYKLGCLSDWHACTQFLYFNQI